MYLFPTDPMSEKQTKNPLIRTLFSSPRVLLEILIPQFFLALPIKSRIVNNDFVLLRKKKQLLIFMETVALFS